MNRGTFVMKFGGTSVGSGAAFSRAARIVAEEVRERPVTVVVSAMSGVTDALLGYAEATARMTTGTTRMSGRTSTGATREGSVAELYRSLADRHLRAAREAVAGEYLPAVEARILELLGRLAEVVAGPDAPADPDARRAEVAVFGERLSAAILAGAIASEGAPAAVVAEDPIATDAVFAEAVVDPAETRRRCTRFVRPLLDAGEVAVVPGYVGCSPEGRPTTLGRGGSDLSATVIGRALDCSEVWILSDVDGVLDADPRLVPDAALLPELSYREAGIFAGLGAKVLHHRTMEPAAAAGLEVRVGNTFDPAGPGTRVTFREEVSGVRCVGLRRSLAVELPCANGHKKEAAAVVCIGSPDVRDAARGLDALRRSGVAVLHHGLATAGLVFVVDGADAEDALRALHGALIQAKIPAEVVA